MKKRGWEEHVPHFMEYWTLENNSKQIYKNIVNPSGVYLEIYSKDIK